jgi:hypothetical protein
MPSAKSNALDTDSMDRFAEYLKHESKISGWYDVECLALFDAIDDAQRAMGVRGQLGEIGIHCGRSFIPLCLMRRKGERALGVDCFDAQHHNRSRSGWSPGNNEATIFWQHVDAILQTRNHIDVMQGDSFSFQGEQYEEMARGEFRIWHIDGGHSFREACHDLVQCWKVTTERGGALIVDDVFNDRWPEVGRAFGRFCEHSQARPVAIGWSKVVLCRAKHAGELRSEIQKTCKPSGAVTWYGDTVLRYG